MRIVKGILALSFVLTLIAGASLTTAPATAASAGRITDVCYDATEQRITVTVQALGDQDDKNGTDKISTRVKFDDYDKIIRTYIPADGSTHTVAFNYYIGDADMSNGIAIKARNLPELIYFDGTGTWYDLPSCNYEAAPVPEGYELMTVTCDTPVFDANGQAVEGTLVTAGQQWYGDPAATGDWTGIFVAGTDPVYVPSACVAP